MVLAKEKPLIYTRVCTEKYNVAKNPLCQSYHTRVTVPKGKSSINKYGKFSKPMNSHEGYIPRKPEWASLNDSDPKTK